MNPFKSTSLHPVGEFWWRSNKSVEKFNEKGWKLKVEIIKFDEFLICYVWWCF